MGDHGNKVMTPTPRTLVLLEEGVSVDVSEFDRLATSSTDLEQLAMAIDLYRGPLLEGCGEEWVLTDRQSREETFLQTTEHAARIAFEAGEFTKAIGFLKRAVAVDPFRESATRSLMEACAANGDHAAAVLAYRQLRERLLYELNSDPSAETNALLERIRKEARVQAQKTSAPITAVVETVSTASFVLPVPPEPRRKGNLPKPLTEIVGREQDLQEIEALLLGARLVTLLGPGGIGKTRLSIEVASNLMADFAGGAWFVDFTPLRDAALVSQHVAAALGIHERHGHSTNEDLVDTLGSEPTLLVLDNCEHLIDATADLAAVLLKSCGGLRIIATSREPLGLSGEVAWRVPSLSVPEPKRLVQLNKELAAALLQYDAVRFFTTRAQAASPGFELTLENAGAVVDICQRLDGIALALELAAARMKVLTVQQISERLSDRFKLLTGGSRGAPTRQQTLRAALEWSYELLSEPERIMLQRLSVFGGVFVIQAVESVTSGDGIDEADALDLISKLVDKSWVRVEMGGDGIARYRLLETTREFARELLDASGHGDTIAERHVDYYFGVGNRARAMLAGPSELEGMRLLERVYDNLRIALHRIIELRDEKRAHEMVELLRQFWSIRERCSEGRVWIQKAIEISPEASLERAATHLAATHYALLEGDYRAARENVEAAVADARALGDKVFEARALVSYASVASEDGDHKEALRLVAESQKTLDSIPGEVPKPRFITAYGLISIDAGLYDEAMEYFHQAIKVCELNGSEHMKGWNCSNLGDALMAMGKPVEALAWYREGLERLAAYAGIFGACEAARGLSLATALATEDRHRRRRAVAYATAAMRNQGSLGLHLRKFDAKQRDRILQDIRSLMGTEAFDDACSEGLLIGFEGLVDAVRDLSIDVSDECLQRTSA
jgi:non-specific serine/threonine protein kinase